SVAGLGAISRSGGTVNLTGTLDASASGLVLDAGTGSWNLAGGTLLGGTYSASGGAELVFTGQGGTLDGGTAPHRPDPGQIANAHATVKNGLTLQGSTVYLGDAANTTYASLSFFGSQSLAGTGTVLFGKSPSNQLSGSGASTLTIASGIHVRGSNGSIG